MKNVFLIASEERQRQIIEEGFGSYRDDQYISGELSLAASAYASHSSFQQRYPDTKKGVRPGVWPWSDTWWKPSADPKRNIIKAMALLAAEYERIERIEVTK